MVLQKTLVLSLLGTALARPQLPFGAGGGDVADGTFAKNIGGFMGLMIPLTAQLGIDTKGDMTTQLCKQFNSNDQMSQIIGTAFGSPNGPNATEVCVKDNSGGSGKYKSKKVEDPTLPGHTIYVPATAPAGKVPVIVWSNGFCLRAGTMFENFLNEITSHGFMVIADGPINHNGNLTVGTTYQDSLDAINWVSNNAAAKKHANFDAANLAVAGQSCGGLDAYGATDDARVKHTVLFNSADFDGSGKKHIAKVRAPKTVAWFLGGARDIAQLPGQRDFGSLPAGVPGLIASADIGHIGTFYQQYGGRMGRAAVSYFSWQMKGEQQYKAQFCTPTPDTTLARDGFKVESKNLC